MEDRDKLLAELANLQERQAELLRLVWEQCREDEILYDAIGYYYHLEWMVHKYDKLKEKLNG